MRVGVVGLEGQRHLVGAHALFELLQRHQGIAEIVPGLGEIALGIDGLQVALGRVGLAAQRVENVAQVEVRLRDGRNLQGAPVRRGPRHRGHPAPPLPRQRPASRRPGCESRLPARWKGGDAAAPSPGPSPGFAAEMSPPGARRRAAVGIAVEIHETLPGGIGETPVGEPHAEPLRVRLEPCRSRGHRPGATCAMSERLRRIWDAGTPEEVILLRLRACTMSLNSNHASRLFCRAGCSRPLRIHARTSESGTSAIRLTCAAVYRRERSASSVLRTEQAEELRFSHQPDADALGLEGRGTAPGSAILPVGSEVAHALACHQHRRRRPGLAGKPCPGTLESFHGCGAGHREQAARDGHFGIA